MFAFAVSLTRKAPTDHWYWNPVNTSNTSSYLQMFSDADEFITKVKKIEAVRKRLSPQTKTFLKELGSIAAGAGGINAALCEGSVRFISDGIDLEIYHRLGERADELVLGDF